jgi:hypothetical protein
MKALVNKQDIHVELIDGALIPFRKHVPGEVYQNELGEVNDIAWYTCPWRRSTIYFLITKVCPFHYYRIVLNKNKKYQVGEYQLFAKCVCGLESNDELA